MKRLIYVFFAIFSVEVYGLEKDIDDPEIKLIADNFKDLSSSSFSSLPHTKPLGGGVYGWYYPTSHTELPRLGKSRIPNSRTRVIHRTSDKVIFDTVYSVDKFSRRINISPIEKHHSKYLLVSGDSFTFGDGISDESALHNKLNQMPSPYYAFNYAESGGSINNLFAKLSFYQDLKEQIVFKNGVLIYIYIDAQVSRLMGRWPNDWTLSSPYFVKTKEEKMVYSGSIGENMSWLRKLIVENAHSLPEFIKKNRYIPRLTNADYEYFCNLLIAAKDEWVGRLKGGEFIFMIHPFVQPDPKIVECLDKNKIVYHHPEVKGSKENFSIPLDGHPTGYFNELFAAEILNYLNKNFK